MTGPNKTTVKTAARSLTSDHDLGQGYRKEYRVRGVEDDDHRTDFTDLNTAAEEIDWGEILEVTVYDGCNQYAEVYTYFELYFSLGAVFGREHGITDLDRHCNDDTMVLTL